MMKLASKHLTRDFLRAANLASKMNRWSDLRFASLSIVISSNHCTGVKSHYLQVDVYVSRNKVMYTIDREIYFVCNRLVIRLFSESLYECHVELSGW
jgi:hypothetical protein